MKIGIGAGSGKTIFLGEHFVVHNLPAIASSLDSKTEVIIKENNKNNLDIIDNRPKVKSFKHTKTEEYKKLFENILDFAGIKKNLKITLAGDLLVCSGGIGASSATSVAFAKALNDLFNLSWDENLIKQASFLGELAIHGNPSGIDNMAAWLGKTFIFQKDSSNNIFIETLNLKNKIEILLIDSGISCDTKQAITLVNNFKLSKTKEFDLICKNYLEIFDLAKKSFMDFDLNLLGSLMLRNHELLNKLGLSITDLDKIVKQAMDFGALGAKITGTGMGGLVLALTPGKDLQNNVAKNFESLGFQVIRTSV